MKKVKKEKFLVQMCRCLLFKESISITSMYISCAKQAVHLLWVYKLTYYRSIKCKTKILKW